MDFPLEIDIVAEGADHLPEDAHRHPRPACRFRQAGMNGAGAERGHRIGRAVLILGDKAAGVVPRDHDIAARRECEAQAQ